MKNNPDWKQIKHFKKYEFDCKCGCGLNNIDFLLAKSLNTARTIANVPFKINSACRCENHNASIGGSPTSSHKVGLAVDIHCIDSSTRHKILKALYFLGFTRIGIYKTFIHVDIDKSKSNQVTWYN